ncbi:MAG: hypothetical protein AAF917_12455 [Pseudomonadota bacterium]
MSNPTIRTSAESSAVYSAEFAPDPLLDALSAGISAACWLVGLALILSTRLPVAALVAAMSLWTMHLAVAIRRPSIRRLRIYANGDCHLQSRDGRWFDGQLMAGSLFLPSIAWVRVSGPLPWRGALVAEDGAGEEWRRLRVMARHFADL